MRALAQPHVPVRAALVGAFVGVLVQPHVARAQNGSDRVAIAQGLYDSAAALIRLGDFAHACPKLEESQRLDPAMGTQFFLATCYERTGRPTSAWSLYVEVASAARATGNVVRERTALARAAALEPRLPRMVVALAEATTALPGLEVARDGVVLKPVVWGTPISVDLGDHTVRATAPGKDPWETTVHVRDMKQRIEVKVPVLTDAPPPPPLVASSPPPSEPAGLPPRRVGALALGSAGVAGIVVGGVLAGMSRSAPSPRAGALGAGSAVAFVAGGAAVAGGLALWLTSPKATATAGVRVVPVAGASITGLLAEGAF